MVIRAEVWSLIGGIEFKMAFRRCRGYVGVFMPNTEGRAGRLHHFQSHGRNVGLRQLRGQPFAVTYIKLISTCNTTIVFSLPCNSYLSLKPSSLIIASKSTSASSVYFTYPGVRIELPEPIL